MGKSDMSKSSFFWGLAASIAGVSLFSTAEIASNMSRAESDRCLHDGIHAFFVTASCFWPLVLLLTSRKRLARLVGLEIFHYQRASGHRRQPELFHLAIEMFENASSSAVVFSANGFAIVIARLSTRSLDLAEMAGAGLVLWAVFPCLSLKRPPRWRL